MGKFEASKKTVLEFFKALDQAAPHEVESVLNAYMSPDYAWRCSYPFRELRGVEEVAGSFWKPLKTALSRMQRRMDIFIGGENEFHPEEQWVMCMGHFTGLFDGDFLGIRHTGKMASLRFAEFNCVKDGKIVKTGLFLDLIGLMQQAGGYPLPPSTGEYFVYPGPRNHNGLLFEDAPAEEGLRTAAVVNKMVEDLDRLNRSGSMEPPTAAELADSGWSEDMVWYGPCGIGATYTTARYIRQHTGPFRSGLTDKQFVGHEVRFAEGSFMCWYGWPNLRNRNSGGFLGLPAGEKPAEMQVVDVYSLEDGKMVENWVIMDIPYWLKQQGLDIFKRTGDILNPAE